jgi:hypothetical protein
MSQGSITLSEEDYSMRQKSVAWLLVLIAFVTILVVGAYAQTIAISGKVMGKAGDPKRLAGITLEGPNRYMAMTNSMGEFRVQNVVPGQYTVTIRQGNNMQRLMVNIGDGNPLNLEVTW